MVLNYKTRGKDVSPQGKPRVYFCCHPDDFPLFFDEISAEILALENCAIFYDESPQGNGDYAEWESRLADMQLFVMPVTSRLLSTGNKGLDEYQLAIKNHIPVLPLMQEKGLDGLFNQVCGNLQYLDKHQVDDTAISYQQKLKNFVESVLIGDVEAEEIRSAFRSYIFLSYRKKDRAHAQRLMKLIHKSDVCQDVAIWYDEYLVPGEDFNNAIGDALSKSHLFLLAVTPNLVCESNYVQSVEYPMALKSGKIILPVEMDVTDRTLLNSQYANIPTVIAESDEQSLLDALLKIFPKQERQQDLRRDYLVALAYLDGVDVEVDHNRSLQMLTQNANANHLDSMRKLVEMYKTGKGVERNAQKVIEWQKRIIQLTKVDGYHADDNAKKDYYYAMWKLGEFYDSLRLYDESVVVYHQMLDFATQWRDSKTNLTASSLFLLNTLRELSYIYQSQLDFSKAREYALQAVYCGEQLVEVDPSEQHYLLLAVCFRSVGLIYEREEKFDEAFSYYEDRLTILETLGQINDYRSSLMRAYIDLFDLYVVNRSKANCLKKMQEYADKFLPIALQLAEEFNDIEHNSGLMFAYQRMGMLCTEQGDLLKAGDWYEKALDMAKQVLQLDDEIASYQNVATMSVDLCINCSAIGDYDKAIEYGLLAKDIWEKLSLESDVTEMKLGCMSIYSMLAKLYRDQNKFDQAIEYNQKTLNILQDLLQLNNTVKLRAKLLQCYSQLASCYEFRDNQKARDYLLKAVEVTLDLQQEYGQEYALDDLAELYSRLGINYQHDDNQKALDYHQKALEIDLQLAEKTNRNYDWDACVVSYTRLASFYVNIVEQYDRAIELCNKAVAIAEKLISSGDDIAFKSSAELAYYLLGYVYYQTEQYDKAVEWYVKMLNLAVEVFDKVENLGCCRRVIIACNHLTECYRDAEDYQSAKDMQIVCAHFCKRFIAITGDQEQSAMLVEILTDIAQLAFYTEQGEEGLDYLLEALEVARHCQEIGVGEIDSVATILNNLYMYYDAMEDADNRLKYAQMLLDQHIAIAEKDSSVEWYVAIAKDTYLVAECYYLMEDDQTAKEYFENSIQLFESCLGIVKDLVDEYAQDEENATPLASSLAQCQKFFAQAHHRYGTFFTAQNDDDQAVSHYDQAVALMLEVVEYTGNLDDWEYLGEIFIDWAMVEGGDALDKAQQIAEILLENDGDNADYQDFAQRVQEESQNW